jgi:hypothetical protein
VQFFLNKHKVLVGLTGAVIKFPEFLAMETANRTERRRTRRARVFRGAQISFRGLRAAIDCTIRNVSESGAKLGVESPIGIPNEFELVQSGSSPRYCHVVWRQPTQIGVEFLDVKA